MLTNNLGYPRIGSNRELKKACESFWSQTISTEKLLETAQTIRAQNWKTQQENGLDLIPSNDFSLYDHVLDFSITVGAIPERFTKINFGNQDQNLSLYFAMARGYQKDGFDVVAMEMTKWFDTNYHYIVPEFKKNQAFKLSSSKIVNEFLEAKQLGIHTKPVILSPVSYLLLGKEKEEGFDRIDLIENLLPVYFEILEDLQNNGASYIQIDEPYLSLELSQKVLQVIKHVYTEIAARFPKLKIILTNYFDCYGDNLSTVLKLPINTLHIDLVKCSLQLEDILLSKDFNTKLNLSLGLVDGRNIWKNDYQQSLNIIQNVANKIGKERVLIASSCSLIHSPCDLDNETNEVSLPAEIKDWMAFAKQKLAEMATLKELALNTSNPDILQKLEVNTISHQNRKTSKLIHNDTVKTRVENLTAQDAKRNSPFSVRQQKQRDRFKLPLFPTTTIGSFPQTNTIRQLRANLKKGILSESDYNLSIEKETQEVIRFQEEIDIDVLVHGEFERNDMVEYFGELLSGYAFSKNGWVQSYGSRCVKPPIIYGDIAHIQDLSVKWTVYAQSLTSKIVKGMLTGPVTMLQWSFVRNDQARSETTYQIALAIRDEVQALEKAGIKIIQIDEPAIREGLPLRKRDWQAYLDWAIKAFRIASSGVNDDTQIHTHMCYSEFNDIIENIANMDADVITIETSRSEMELLEAFVNFKYPNEIGPGVYDIHSPRIPTVAEITNLLEKATAVLPAQNIWVNPDCGLKTRAWAETRVALKNMVQSAKLLREKVVELV